MNNLEKGIVRPRFVFCLLLLVFTSQSFLIANSLQDQENITEWNPISVPELRRDETLFGMKDENLTEDISFKHKSPSGSQNSVPQTIKPSSEKFPIKADIRGSNWGDYSFKYRKNITIDNTKIPSDLPDFPVLVVLYDRDLRYHTQAEGNDIIFKDSSNKLLNHELEHYEATYNTTHAFLVAWIRVPVLSSTMDTTISMYYGNSTIESQENATGVWGDNFAGVWHLTDLNGSSSNSNDGTNQGSTDEAGQIGRAQRFDGINDYISLGVWDPGIGTGNYSISAWVRLDDTFNSFSSESMPIFGHYEHASYDMVLTFAGTDNNHGSNGMLYSKVEGTTDNNYEYIDSTTTSWPGNTWIHIVATNDRTNEVGVIYKDKTGEGGIGFSIGNPTFSSTGNYSIGRIDLDQTYDDPYEAFSGVIDELRLYKGVLSADWITTEYNNQYDPMNFYTVGDEEGDLEVLIDTEVYDAIDEYNPGPNVVFVNNSHGYVFLQKRSGGIAEIAYYKTTNNGSTWEGPAFINPQGFAFRSFSCWYDQWTPENYGTKIHFIVNSYSRNEMMYNYLDTKDDSTNETWTKIMNSGGFHNAPDGGGAITVSSTGNLFGASWMTNGPQFAKFEQNSWYDITPSYSFLDYDDDHGQLLPLSGGDILCLYEDATENTLYSFIYDEESDTWDTTPKNLTTIVSETVAPEDAYNNNANWGAVSDPNTCNVFLVLNNDILSAQGVIESWEFLDSDRSWIQKTDVATLGVDGDEVKPAYDPNSNTLFAITIVGNSIYVQNSTDRGVTWSTLKKVSSVTEAWIVLRTSFISAERIYTIYFVENDPNDDLVYGNTIADLPEPQGNATIKVNVVDLDSKKVPNARVNLTKIDFSYEKTKNTTLNGFTSFTNVTFGYYNLTVEFEDTINQTYELQQFTSNSSYHLNPIISILVIISEYVDNSPPVVRDIFYENESSQFGDIPVFFTNITDESSLREVNLNLTVIKTIGEETAIQDNFTMVHLSGDQYYNATTLDTLDDFNARAYYNIIAIDIAYNIIVTRIKTVYLGDGFPPNIVSYNVTDFKNGTLRFYANITDNMSEVYDPVLLQIDDSFLIPMHHNASGFWVATLQAAYDDQVKYTIYSANDTIGNENGSKLYTLSPPYGLVVPGDDVLPNIITEIITSHYQGRVEFLAYIDDHSVYQSGINASSVFLHINQSDTIETFPMIEIEGVFQLELEFEFADCFYYWVTAEDLAGNNNTGLLNKPFSIDDNSIPQISYWKIDWGNGTVDFYAEVIDWPFNETSAYLLFSQNYFNPWINLSMTEISESNFFARVGSLEYDLRNLWYYVSATDTLNWNDPGISQASNFTLSDSVSPIITYSIENSTENDGEITVLAYAIDPYGDTNYVNNTLYINFTHLENNIIMPMDFDIFNSYKTSHAFPFGDQVGIQIWVEDNAGNLGEIDTAITIDDFTPPNIIDYGPKVYQNGTVIIWAEVVEGDYGSGLLETNTSVILDYIDIFSGSLVTDTMTWNGTGNFYIYSISGFRPGLSFTYTVSAFDKQGNLKETLWEPVSIYDLTPPIYESFNYQEITLNHYSSLFTFWVDAVDPFGTISKVSLLIHHFNSSESWNTVAEMHYNGSLYIYSLQMIHNCAFNYSIAIQDEALNTIIIGESNVRILEYHPAEIIDHGIERLQQDQYIGKVLIWGEIHDPFKDHNVTLSIFDETNSTWILNQIPIISNGTHYIYSLSIPYLHNFIYLIQVFDSGVNKGYYNPAQCYSGVHQMLDYWAPVIHST
ncbi:MAG: DUF2341 domain-containing protein, partial [Promethearchaeota archaeon]